MGRASRVVNICIESLKPLCRVPPCAAGGRVRGRGTANQIPALHGGYGSLSC